jgi:hypothetical protein
MPLVTVYRFKYFDRDAKAFKDAEDLATPDAIREMGAILLPGSATAVDRSLVSRRGILVKPKRGDDK